MIHPASRLLTIVLAWLVLAVGAVAVPALVTLWLWLGGGIGLICVLDALVIRLRRPIIVERRLPGRFALGQPGEVRLILKNPQQWPAIVEVFDGMPAGSIAEALPWKGAVPALREIRVFHPVKIMQRGEASFGPVHIRMDSLLGLWRRRTLHLLPEKVKV